MSPWESPVATYVVVAHEAMPDPRQSLSRADVIPRRDYSRGVAALVLIALCVLAAVLP
jgi:hypothetical protein